MAAVAAVAVAATTATERSTKECSDAPGRNTTVFNFGSHVSWIFCAIKLPGDAGFSVTCSELRKIRWATLIKLGDDVEMACIAR